MVPKLRTKPGALRGLRPQHVTQHTSRAQGRQVLLKNSMKWHTRHLRHWSLFPMDFSFLKKKYNNLVCIVQHFPPVREPLARTSRHVPPWLEHQGAPDPSTHCGSGGVTHSHSVPISQGFRPLSSASLYVLWKSLKRGAQPSRASPKCMWPVKRNSPRPGLTPHCSSVVTRPRQPPPSGAGRKTLLFCR